MLGMPRSGIARPQVQGANPAPAWTQNVPREDNAIHSILMPARDHVAQRSITIFNAQELVRIKHHRPVTVGHERVVLCVFQRRRLWLYPIPARYRCGGDAPSPVPRAVSACHQYRPSSRWIGHQIREPDAQMMRHPPHHLVPLVLDRGKSRHPTMRADVTFERKLHATKPTRRIRVLACKACCFGFARDTISYWAECLSCRVSSTQ